MNEPRAFYSEFDGYAAQWLRNLIEAGHIAPGVVDERDIRLIEPDELKRFTQVHAFAGIGVWSYALRRAGWPDSRPVWSGSCPCQPFSAAGEGKGHEDPRHLWPTWARLIRECRPECIVGEQVASRDGLAWLDLVCADMEDARYAIAAVDIPAAGVRAPHIRQRLYFLAHPIEFRREQGREPNLNGARNGSADHSGEGFLAHTERSEWGQGAERGGDDHAARAQRPEGPSRLGGDSSTGALADAGGAGLGSLGRRILNSQGDARPHAEQYHEGRAADAEGRLGHTDERRGGRDAGAIPSAQGEVGESVRGESDGAESSGAIGHMGDPSGPGLSLRERDELLGARRWEEGRATEQSSRSFWSDADWILCRDGKARPVEPGTFPLVTGSASRLGRVRADQERIASLPRKDQGNRIGRLRGYGNAINAEVAIAFIRAAMSVMP